MSGKIYQLGVCAVAFAMAFALISISTSSDAAAETVRAKRASKVYADRGEQSRAVTRVKAGSRLLVLRREGRWIKVRVNGRTGWIPRSILVVSTERKSSRDRRVSFQEGRNRDRKSKRGPRDRVGADATREGFVDPDSVDEPDEREERKSRRRVRDRDEDEDQVVGRRVAARTDEPRRDRDDFDGELAIVRDDETDLLASPDLDAKPVEVAAEGDELTVLDREGRWLLVENEDGTEGWIRSSSVSLSRDAGNDDDDDDEEDDSIEDEVEPYKREKLTWQVDANLGFTVLGQTFRSDSTQALGNYSISANAFALALGGGAVYKYSKRWLFGGEAGASFSRATPGIRFQDPASGMGTDIAFSTLGFDLGGRAGYDFGLRNGLAVFARLGLVYSRMDVAGSSGANLNPARLPSEVLIGPRLGVLAEVPEIYHRGIWRKFSASMHLDFLPGFLTSRAQTAGLEDGASSSARAFMFGLKAGYRFAGTWNATFAYDLLGAKTSWSGVAANSQRGHSAMSANRTDRTHAVMIGAGKSF